jgi:hypothetical protein
MKRRIPFLGLFCMLLASSGLAESLPLDHAEILRRLAPASSKSSAVLREAIEELQSLLIGHPAAAEPSDGLVEIYLEQQDRKSGIAETAAVAQGFRPHVR